ncbi:putative ribonuclease H-like domain-containing protein [Tanacetum coccineum]
MSIDDLYNNFKIVEQEVKRSVTSSSNSGSQNMVFVSTPSSTNDANTANVQVSTVNSTVSTGNTIDNTASLTDATVYAFLANQPNGSQLVHEDLEQIHEDDLEEMDLKWQFALLSMRARKFYQRTGKKITINASDTAEETTPYKRGLASIEDNLRIQFNKSEFDLATYKRGLASIEEQLVFYKKNEVMFTDQIAVLKRDASFNESEIISLKCEIERLNRKGLGYNDVPPLPTGLFAPPSIDLSNYGVEEFKQPKFEGYGVKVNKSVCENSSNEIKKTPYAPIIEEWVSDSDEDESEVMISDNVQHKPEQANQPRKFTKKACFVCRSFNHLIKDCDFHDKKMVQKHVMNNVQKGTGQREVRLVWNNVIRTNHQNFSNSRRNFATTAVFTKSGILPISTARQSSSRVAAPVSASRPINTATFKPLVNVAKPRTNAFWKSHSLSRRPFYQQTALKNRILNNKVNTAKINSVNTAKGTRVTSAIGKQGINGVKSSGDPQVALKDTGIFDSGCSRHMTGNKCYLTDYQDYDGGFVAFAGSSKEGKITGKGKIRTGNLDFEDVYFVKELKFNLFSVSQMHDKKNSVLFTETECLILSPDFKLPDENQVVLKIPRKDNMYSFDLKNIVPSKGLTCVFTKATNDESKLWHRRLGHINFNTLNKLVKGNLVRGLPSKIFENDHTCVACQFSWVFFLAKKDETSGILKNFITDIENQLNHKVKIIRCDNGTELKNYEMNQFCGIKGIKREFSNARTPQQNGVAERNNRTLIEAARTMVLVTKPHNKTPYELLIGRTPIISFMRPFVYPVTILNTLDHLGKFDGKADEGVLVGYYINSKAFRVYNHRTRKVEENLYVNFLENKPNVAGNGPEWLFDIDSLTNTINYQPVSAGNRTNGNAVVSSPNNDAAGKKTEQQPANEEDQTLKDAVNKMMNKQKEATEHSDDVKNQFEAECNKKLFQGLDTRTSTTNSFNTVNTPVNTASASRTFYPAGPSSGPPLVSFDGSLRIDVHDYPDDLFMPNLKDTAEPQGTGILDSAYDDDDIYNSPFVDQDVGAEADFNNMEPSIVGYRQEEGIDYDEIFAPVARIEAIRQQVLQLRYKPLSQDTAGTDVDVHLYRSMIGSLMYLTSSRPDIMFAVCACSRFQVQPKASHMQAVKRIFRYLKGVSLDRKSTTGGCQFLGYRLISWQCKKQIIVANLTTEAEYIAASNCYGQCWLYTTQQMVINSPCLTDKKELAIPGQTATGKELSNPLMADSLPKTILPTTLMG